MESIENKQNKIPVGALVCINDTVGAHIVTGHKQEDGLEFTQLDYDTWYENRTIHRLAKGEATNEQILGAYGRVASKVNYVLRHGQGDPLKDVDICTRLSMKYGCPRSIVKHIVFPVLYSANQMTDDEIEQFFVNSAAFISEMKRFKDENKV